MCIRDRPLHESIAYRYLLDVQEKAKLAGIYLYIALHDNSMQLIEPDQHFGASIVVSTYCSVDNDDDVNVWIHPHLIQRLELTDYTFITQAQE